MSLWEIVENVFNEYLIGPSPAMRNVLLRWRKLFTPLGPEVSLSSAWPVASASPELENKFHCARSCPLIMSHLRVCYEQIFVVDLIVFITSIQDNTCLFTVITLLCITCLWYAFGSSNHQTILGFWLVLFEITEDFLKCVSSQLLIQNFLSLSIQGSFYFFCLIYLWVQLSDCVSPDTLGHAFHNLHFTSADVNLLNLSQKWKQKFTSL